MRRILDNAQRVVRGEAQRIPDGTWTRGPLLRREAARRPADATACRSTCTSAATGCTIDNKGTDPQAEGPIGFVFTSFAGVVLGVVSRHDALRAACSRSAARSARSTSTRCPALLTCVDYPAAVSGGVMSIAQPHERADERRQPDAGVRSGAASSDIVGARPECPLLVLAGTNDRGELLRHGAHGRRRDGLGRAPTRTASTPAAWPGPR